MNTDQIVHILRWVGGKYGDVTVMLLHILTNVGTYQHGFYYLRKFITVHNHRNCFCSIELQGH